MFEYSMEILTPQKKLTAHFLVQLSIATFIGFFSQRWSGRNSTNPLVQ